MKRVILPFIGLCLIYSCGSEKQGSSKLKSYYWNAGLQPANPTVCWVNNAASKYPSEVKKIETVFKEWQNVSGLKLSFTGDCLPPVNVNGKDVFPGDIRVLLQMSSWPSGGKQIPGKGCTDLSGSQKIDRGPLWAAGPNEKNDNCLYNMHVTPNEARNNCLHEFGHSIGLQHEHERQDATCRPQGSNAHLGGTAITKDYDILSVMHYVVSRPDCNAPGNWANSGLSDGDILAAQIMYPASFNADIWGSSVYWVGQKSFFKSSWEENGANINLGNQNNSMMKNLSWNLRGRQYSTKSLLSNLPIGRHTLEMRYKDYWNRDYFGRLSIEVLTKKEFVGTRVVPSAASSLAMLF